MEAFLKGRTLNAKEKSGKSTKDEVKQNRQLPWVEK